MPGRDEAFPAARPEVHVLVPFAVEDGRRESPEYDTDAFRAELDSWFAPNGLRWHWRPVVPAEVGAIAAGLGERARAAPLVAFNLCDGFDTDGYPGPSLLDALARNGVPFTGGGPAFYRVSSDKLAMKARFVAAGVPTARFRAIADPDRDIPALAAEVGFPAILKLAGSSAGGGLSRASVVDTAEAARERHATLIGEGYGPLRVYAEQFLAGRESTVLVRDAPGAADGLATLPAVEMRYDRRVPVHERILFEGHRTLDVDGRPREEGGPARVAYVAAPAEVSPALEALAKAAYRATGGEGYARVDLRTDPETGTTHVLEVNTNPELSRAAPTIQPALAAAGLSFEALIGDILGAALARARDGAMA